MESNHRSAKYELAAFPTKLYRQLELENGLEPPTFALQKRRSAN